MPSSLSKESEKKITRALEKVADFLSNGMTPNDAIIKAAGEDKIPLGHVSLMISAVNTGCTNAHRMSHSDPLEKAADFPIADAETIFTALFPDKVETKQASYVKFVVSDEYDRPPDWLFKQRSRKKVATALPPLTTRKPVVNTDPDKPYEVAMNTVRKNYRTAEEARLKLAEVREKATAVVTELREYFTRPYAIPLQEVTENSEILFGKQASAVLSAIPRHVDYYFYKQPTPVNLQKQPYSLIKQAILLAKEFTEANEEYKSLLKKANEEAIEKMRPFGPGPAQGRSVLEGLYSTPKSELTKESFFGPLLAGAAGAWNAGSTGNIISREIAKRMGPNIKATDDLAKDDLKVLADPMHELEIRNIQAEALLNDLMANDEIIRGYDPEEVVDAFNEISQLTPYSMGRKPIMRDLIRKRLSGGPQALDQFTVGDTLKSQQSLQDIDQFKEEKLRILNALGIFNYGEQPKPPVAQK